MIDFNESFIKYNNHKLNNEYKVLDVSILLIIESIIKMISI